MAVPSVLWDGTYDGTPAGSDDPRAADDRMREIKVSVRERAEREHGGTTTEASARHGVHRAGSARASYASGDPTTVPDAGSTRALNSTDDDGRLHVDATSKRLKVYDGSAWQYPIADGGLHLKKIDIGDWNMDTTASVNVAHGLTLTKIIGISVLVRNDTDDGHYPFAGFIDSAGYMGRFILNSVNVVLTRELGCTYDSPSYDSTSFNRGWILIWYID